MLRGGRRWFSSSEGFFSRIRRQVEEELSKNRELKESMEKLRKDRSLNEAAAAAERAAKEAARKAKEAARKAESLGDATKRTAAEAAERASKLAEKGAESERLRKGTAAFSRAAEKLKRAGEDVGGRAKEAAEDVGDKAKRAAESSGVGKSLRDRMRTFSEHPRVSGVVGSLREAELLDGWGDAARELFGAKRRARKVKVEGPVAEEASRENDDDDDDDEEPVAEATYDGPGALMQVEAERTGWQRFAERLSRTPIIEDILSGTRTARRVVGRSKVGRAAGEAKTAVDDVREELRERWETSQNPWVYRVSAAYDAAFAETEEAQCISEVRRLDPDFNLHLWLEELRDDTIPHVVEAYLRMDEDELERDLSEGAFAQVSAAIRQRKTEGTVMDPNLLHVDPPELIAAQLVDRGPPIFVCSALAQQINCFRDAKTGDVVEGAEDDIRYVHYVFAMQRDYDEDARELAWRVIEMRVQVMDKMI